MERSFGANLNGVVDATNIHVQRVGHGTPDHEQSVGIAGGYGPFQADDIV
ncbi:MAG: hypothetical protein U0414_16835 [Polyangiaceae bacterium]